MKSLIYILPFLKATHATNVAVPHAYHVPTFTTCEIQSGDQDDKLQKILTTTGLLAIRVPVSDYESNGRDSHILQDLCRCEPHSLANIANADSSVLADGVTTRSTIATASKGSIPIALPETDINTFCGKGVYDSLEKMRDYVSDAASGAFIPALDRIIQKQSMQDDESNTIKTSINRRELLSTLDKSKQYSTVASIFEDSNHLEHFHLYSKNSQTRNDAVASDNALDWHTDGGLFLAFIPGQHCNGKDKSEDDSFRISVQIGSNSRSSEMKAVFPDSSLYKNEVVVAIMLGAGAEHWLNTPKSLNLKATKHAVKMKSGDQRAWYGMMHLVPTQAIIQHSPVPRTFGEMKQSSVHSVSRTFGSSTSNNSETDIVIGCGNDHTNKYGSNHVSRPYRRLQHVSGQKACSGSGNYFCWLSCLSTPGDDDESYLAKGESLYCYDPSVLAETGDLEKAVKKCSDPVSGKAGGVMDEACHNQWHPTVEGVKSYLQPSDEPADETDDDNEKKYCYGSTAMYMQGFEWEGTTCVAYLFSSWVISTRLALVLACLGTIFLSIITEVVTSGRRKFLQRSYTKNLKIKLTISAALYGLQVTMGYAVMLLIMTYSGPLVLSVIIGLMIGHVITNWNIKSSDEIELGGSTPCCQYEGDRQDDNGHNDDNEVKEGTLSDSTIDLGGCCDRENNLTV